MDLIKTSAQLLKLLIAIIPRAELFRLIKKLDNLII